ncbi:hypothetical protein A2886_00270 [candidate division WWE3 bacterium RIFCSPHIGHO2_01_FULL_42_13]|uniref:Uncharacterized protein n=1 Tax=candidate division WWE3 bacterium RIFCSPHIGHO2_01_FULL_42_13 TaxID=1802617 RepID=A0A1F4US86_UNCKA|nr:MAG: hypothetical protein A2886_00270 [candidate division WWE3 bacterium RIFCSPHIGHO2_01_FULL_42_13]
MLANLLQPVYAVTLKQVTITNITSLTDVFTLAVNVVLGIGISLTIIFLILGGIQYITSKGDQKAAQEARTSLTNAVIGFIVVIGAFTIKTVMVSILGASGGGVEEPVPNIGL